MSLYCALSSHQQRHLPLDFHIPFPQILHVLPIKVPGLVAPAGDLVHNVGDRAVEPLVIFLNRFNITTTKEGCTSTILYDTWYLLQYLHLCRYEFPYPQPEKELS